MQGVRPGWSSPVETSTLHAVQSTVLPREVWQARAAAHEERVDVWVQPHLARRRQGIAHPVHDFLFSYYSHRPAALRRWHPGYGVTLLDAPEYADLKGYATHDGGRAASTNDGGRAASANDGGRAASASERSAETRSAETRSAETRSAETTVTTTHLDSRRPLLESVRHLLAATASRPPALGCFGLHEWAMVYRDEHLRHPWPLRLGAAGTDAVVESHRIGCSHFDAFRFFTEPARPLNTLQPGPADRPELEQPGCLHASMDLYKHAFRLSPLVASELVADCFALAWDVRELDMRASPYDLADLGYPPVRIETSDGKAEYVAAQRSFAERAAPLRQRLVEECDRLLSAAATAARTG
jgi:hypothetical protein